MVCEWDPDTPAPKSLTPKEVQRYREARNELVAQVSERLGGRALIIELG